MIAALVTGTLYGAPQEKTSKTGRSYVSAVLKVHNDSEATSWVRITAFSESAQAESLRLGDGDSLSVQGPLNAELYERDDGEKRLSLSLIVNHVLALRQSPKERSPKAVAKPSDDLLTRDYRSKEERRRGLWSGPDDGPNDSLDNLSF